MGWVGKSKLFWDGLIILLDFLYQLRVYIEEGNPLKINVRTLFGHFIYFERCEKFESEIFSFKFIVFFEQALKRTII